MDLKSVSYSEYELRLKSSVAMKRVGALLRFEFADGFGFADCHPWPEFGDQPLNRQLSLLAKCELTSLTQRSYGFAKLDFAARLKKENLLSTVDIPRSHFLVPNISQLSQNTLGDVWNSGFRELKIKLGRDPIKEVEKINDLFTSSKPWTLRFDFNSLMSIEQLREFFLQLHLDIFAKIEFIEDPIPGVAEEWFELQDELGVTFARDFAQVENSEAHYFVRVVKPAVQDPAKVFCEEPESVEFVVTTYMDHPLGQACAAYTAAQVYSRWQDRCLLPGLLHHPMYEPHAFSEYLNFRHPVFQPIEGTGFGFDRELERQLWKGL